MFDLVAGRRLGLAAVFFTLAACAPTVVEKPPEEKPVFTPASLGDLPGWGSDDPAPALSAFIASCARLPKDDAAAIGPGGVGGKAGDWRAACAAAKAAGPGQARAVFEQQFATWSVTTEGREDGLFTGYYEPELRGSRRRGGRFQTPLYQRPGDLVTADLAKFKADLKGEIAGRVEDGRLLPYHDRAAISGGVLAGKALELAWVDDAVDAFFLEIQGSGRVVLEDGSLLRAGYAAKNGRPYVALGRELMNRGDLPRDQVTMQSIRAWLAAHPDQAQAAMNLNPSYVFFRELDTPGAVGGQGVVLTPGRSLAIDRKLFPYGAPVWLDAAMPDADASRPDQVLRRLVIAQDTGGAITGPIRGDVFFGAGAEAAEIAGRMKHRGRWWWLLPRGVDPRRAAP